MSEPKSGRRRRPRRGGKRSGSRSGASTSSARSSGNRSRQRRRPSKASSAKAKNESRSKKEPVVVPQNGSKQMRITGLNREIFIYTYTHYPRAGSDNYQAGPGVAERMEFED